MMTYTIRKHAGLRTSMAHVHNGSYGRFNDLADAVAWANLKHDGLNYTYVCLDDGEDVIYGIIPDGKGYTTDAMQAHTKESPHLLYATYHYRLQKVAL